VIYNSGQPGQARETAQALFQMSGPLIAQS
jgi:hypothetical protein